MGAQRLSASFFVSRCRCGLRVSGLIRAQRLSESLFVPLVVALDVRARSLVLNAFRHHCSFHITESTQPFPHWMCSTPFGIIVRSTFDVEAECWRLAGCSTPFGIIVRSTSFLVDSS